MRSELSVCNSDLVELLKDTLNKGASFRFQVKGFSMSPFIKDSDVVTVAPFLNSPVRFGWPVAFLKPKSGNLAIHRVVGKHNGHFLIKGDSSIEADGLVAKEDIFGYVKKIERNGGIFYFGLGPERVAIAFLSKAHILPFIFWGWRLIPLVVRKTTKHRLGAI